MQILTLYNGGFFYVLPRNLKIKKGNGAPVTNCKRIGKRTRVKERDDMIKLTKFNSQINKKGEFVLNAEIIETIEETPDTVVTLTNGKKFIVDEPMDEVVRRVMKYRRALHQF